MNLKRSFVQFVDENNCEVGRPISIPLNSSSRDLNRAIRKVIAINAEDTTTDLSNKKPRLDSEDDEQQESVHYSFYVDNVLVLASLADALRNNIRSEKNDDGEEAKCQEGGGDASEEGCEREEIRVLFQAEAAFRVLPITRCQSSVRAHSNAVLVAKFSPDTLHLATAGGDKRLRFWDVNTGLPLEEPLDELEKPAGEEGKKQVGKEESEKKGEEEAAPAKSCWRTAHPASIKVLEWSPNSRKLATVCDAGKIVIWTLKCRPTSKQQPANQTSIPQEDNQLEVDRQWRPNPRELPRRTTANLRINAFCWRPLHLDSNCRLAAAACHDHTVCVWDTVIGRVLAVMAGHDKPVISLRWGGTDLVYSGSHDCTANVWAVSSLAPHPNTDKDATTDQSGSAGASGHPILCRKLKTHSHWITSIALSTDFALRNGNSRPDQRGLTARQVYEMARNTTILALEDDNNSNNGGQLGERMALASEDGTLSLWTPETSSKPINARMTGHQAAINEVQFSADGRLVASASFDKSVRVWCGATGQFIDRCLGHVQAVYLVRWSADSRQLVSASRDSTLKLWRAERSAQRLAATNAQDKLNIDAKTGRPLTDKQLKKRGVKQVRASNLIGDLPGHADAVYALDWSSDGSRVVSGGKDGVVKLWR